MTEQQTSTKLQPHLYIELPGDLPNPGIEPRSPIFQADSLPSEPFGGGFIFLKEISPEYSLEGLMLKLKLQYFGHLMQRTDSLERP